MPSILALASTIALPPSAPSACASGACPAFGGTVLVHIKCVGNQLRGARGQHRLYGQIVCNPYRCRCRVRIIAWLWQGVVGRVRVLQIPHLSTRRADTIARSRNRKSQNSRARALANLLRRSASSPVHGPLSSTLATHSRIKVVRLVTWPR